MKTGLTLPELAAELERQATVKVDYRVDTRALKVEVIEDRPMVTLTGTAEPFALTDRANSQISGALGIPKKYWDRMATEAPDLVALNANHWLKEQPKTQLVRTLDGKVRAFLGSAYRIVDNISMIGHLLPELRNFDEDVRYESMGLTDDFLYIKAVTPRLRGEVREGDVVQGGIVISNSEVGAGSIAVAPLIYRLVCSNGMIRDEGSLRRRHVGSNIKVGEGEITYGQDTVAADDHALSLKVRDNMRHILNGGAFDGILSALRHSTEQVIQGDPVRAVERLTAAESLKDKDRASIMGLFLGEKDFTRYGMAQAVTATARDVDDYEHATELERLGWHLAAGTGNDHAAWMYPDATTAARY